MRLLKNQVLPILLLLICFCQTGAAQSSLSVVHPTTANRLGMEVMWRTQVKIGPTSKLQSIAQVFGKSKKLVKYVVTFEDILEEFYEDDVDRFGRKIGVDGAKARAEARLERYKSIDADAAKMERVVEDPAMLQTAIAEAKNKYETAQGFEKGRIAQQMISMEARRQRLLPEITFLAQSSTSMVQSIDGRNGKTQWTQQVGKRNHPSQPIVAKRNHFAVVNASHVYCGLMENGRVIWQQECRGAPGSRDAMTRNSIFVPMVDGFVEQFEIRDGNAPTGDIVSMGRSPLGATSSDYVVAWPSDRGELNVAFDVRDAKEVSYRLVPKRKIVSNAAFLPPYLFATSTDGSIYCLKETNGTMVWDLPTGISISNSPFPVGKHVYFVDDNQTLTQVSIDAGIPIWTAERIREIVAVSGTRVYCLNLQRHLVILDKKNGSYVGALTTKPVEFFYQNSMTDRVVVGTERGLIQCLRETSQVEPVFHETPETAAESKEGSAGESSTQPNNTQKGDDNNPFGAGGGAKGGGNNDPFGGVDDPFGGGGNKNPPAGGGASDDPFGN